MFIILGSPRSGTTLLSETLNSHPDIFVATETDFIIPAAFLMDRIKDAKIGKRLLVETLLNTRDSRSITAHLSEAQIAGAIAAADYDLSSILKAIYGELASVSQKRVAGDKSPNDLMYQQILETTGLFSSDIKFIHIVRNIRDVCASLREVAWAPVNVAEYFPRIWSFSNCHLHQRLRGRPNYWLVRYESLIADFDQTVARACGFLELPMNADMLHPQARARRLGMLPHHQNLGKEISDVIKDRVRPGGNVPVAEKHFYEQAAEGLATFGYAEA